MNSSPATVFRVLALLMCIGLAGSARAQNPRDVLWTRMYGGNAYDEANTVKRTPDGGYIIAGYTQSFGLGRWGQGYIVKTNATGDTAWTRLFGDAGIDVFVNVEVTRDSGYVLTGLTDSQTHFEQLWLLRLDRDGALLWSKSYGGLMKEIGYEFVETDDGGFLIVGTTASYGAAEENLWLLRTNAQGDSLWAKTYGWGGKDFGRSIRQTFDGGYIIAGTAHWADAWLVKINAAGDTLWTRAINGGGYEEAASVVQAPDGGYLLFGNTDSFGAGGLDMLLVKTDSLGNTVWTKTYGGVAYDEGWKVLSCSMGGYLLAGNSGPDLSPDMKFHLLRINEAGDTLWTTIIGDTSTNRCFSVIEDEDGGFVVAGSMFHPENDGDATIVKIRGDNPTHVADDHVPAGLSPRLIGNFPNPFNPATIIRFYLPASAPITLTVYDFLGREVRMLVKNRLERGTHAVTFDASGLASGIYFCRLESGEFLDAKKMMLVK